ncbi:hypothetical protein GWK47_007409 [Chionoecetes opilio]|uniref:Uncharacterized protein n=1 Tax=Chionoecetes opilio TaxID=41210 RepID=A0A8J4Y0V1_CHIOP|nr:hypothetical protein GWK47_007409 [Chionoecetes opilio]
MVPHSKVSLSLWRSGPKRGVKHEEAAGKQAKTGFIRARGPTPGAMPCFRSKKGQWTRSRANVELHCDVEPDNH